MEFFEVIGTRGYYRPEGEMALQEITGRVDRALELARQLGLTEMLVNVLGVTGFPSPSVFERYQFISRWADIAGGNLVLAMVAPAEMIDPGRFGVTVAMNRGLITNVFSSETEAVGWLEARA